MKRLLQLVLMFIGASFYTYAQNKQTLSLDGSWMFSVDSIDLGRAENWEDGLPGQVSREVQVPHTWNVDEGIEDYAGSAWYQKEFEIPDDCEDKAVRLKFGAVYHDAKVFVNGKMVGENLNAGYTPFSFDITRYIRFDEPNHLVVLVNNAYSEQNLPYKRAFDWVNDGGITRSVLLEATGRPSLRYVRVDPKINLDDSSGTAKLSIKLWEKNVRTVKFEFALKEKDSGKTILSGTKELHLKDGEYSTTLELGKVMPWHFDSPNLYVLETSIKTKKGISDNEISIFGFKRVEITGEDLFLNREKVRLPGIEYMPGSNPEYGIVEPRSYMDSIVRTMKDLNVCVTRFHWQQDDYMMQLMDKYGILVQEELPWWQRPAELTPELVKTARKQLGDVIEAHYNHPSIFSWGISNEVNGSTSKSIYKELRNFIKGQDPTRFVTIVSNRIWQKQENDETLLGDMPTWNEYIGTWHGNDRNELPDKLDVVNSALGNRPLLITENGLCEPANTGGDMRRIDDMLFHIKHWSSQPWVIGYIYFCLSDYRTQMGEEGFSKYQIRRHGITDVALNPKPSYSVLKQLASPVNIIEVKRVDDSTALVEIKIKSDIPHYTLRSYKLQYETIDNKLIDIDLPDLKPGDTYTTELKRVNQRFAFKILRPNGFSVVEY